MHPDSRIFIAGHRGMVGSAIMRALQKEGHLNLLTHSRAELDLRDAAAVNDFFHQERPEYVFLAAAKVGGIVANDTRPADFLLENLEIQTSVITAAWRTGVCKLLFLGSSCIYPKHAPQPIPESALMTGPLEPTNEWYATAKIAGIRLCQALRRQHGADFISCMPTNLYGPNDNYHPEHSHVLPGMIRRFHAAGMEGAGSVTCWGTGAPLREFMHADDLAAACLFLMRHYSGEEIINVGSGQEVSIRELAGMVAAATGFTGRIEWDTARPDGTPRKLLDSSRLAALGWKPQISLAEGIADACADYLQGARSA